MKSSSQSFTEVYREYRDSLFRYCAVRVFDREIALELAQEVFIKYWDTLQDGKEIHHPKAYLYKIATNKIIDHVRKKRPAIVTGETADLLLDGMASSSNTAALAELNEALACLSRLSRKDAILITLRLVEGLSFKEIAETLGMRVNTATVAFHRAKKRLDTLIESYE